MLLIFDIIFLWRSETSKVMSNERKSQSPHYLTSLLFISGLLSSFD